MGGQAGGRKPQEHSRRSGLADHSWCSREHCNHRAGVADALQVTSRCLCAGTAGGRSGERSPQHCDKRPSPRSESRSGTGASASASGAQPGVHSRSERTSAQPGVHSLPGGRCPQKGKFKARCLASKVGQRYVWSLVLVPCCFVSLGLSISDSFRSLLVACCLSSSSFDSDAKRTGLFKFVRVAQWAPSK
jgi:hypothetical protein